MNGKSKIFLGDARRFAEQICVLLEPACERIEIAGSIRRRAAIVGDIEIVCVPKLTPERVMSLSAVDDLVESLIPAEKGTLAFERGPDTGLRWNSERPANGSRYKRLIWVGQSGALERVPVDLFCVLPPASWGALLAIRTGPSDFSKGLVTSREFGGAMPDKYAQAHGALWERPASAGLDRRKIPTPEEEDYFAALGLPCWSPEERTAERLEEYLTGTSPAGSD